MFKRRVIGSVVLLILIALLVACSSISAGRITGKVVEPERVYYTQQCVSYNAKGLCSVWMPMRHVDDVDYRFDIEDDSDNTGWVYVTPETYENYSIGDWFDAGN